MVSPRFFKHRQIHQYGRTPALKICSHSKETNEPKRETHLEENDARDGKDLKH